MEIENPIESCIKYFMEKNNIPDLKKEPQNVFTALLSYMRKRFMVKNGINILNNTSPEGHMYRYNIDRVEGVLDIYIDLCTLYDKEVSIIGFSVFTGIDYNTIDEWYLYNKNTYSDNSNRQLSSKYFSIAQRLIKFNEETLSAKLVSGKQNPVGVIAKLNHVFSWQSPFVAEAKAERQLIARETIQGELPKPAEKLPEIPGQFTEKEPDKPL